jgi:hypothetical protein
VCRLLLELALVNRRFQFVALTLALILLAGTMAVFADCLRPSESAAMQCPPECPMMTAHQSDPGQQLKAEAQRSSCCEISSGKPVPTSVPQPAGSGTDAGVIEAKASPAMPVPSAPESRNDSVPILLDVSAQAVLCTFLI